MIDIVTYRPELKQRFIELNTEWINAYFRIEKHDVEAFQNVEENVMSGGGEILFALDNGVAVGCCALVHHLPANKQGEWELAKMAVAPGRRGMGIGNRLMEALLREAARRQIGSIYLEGNTRLKASIAMYRKFGFHEEPLQERNYERVDILMRWKNNSKNEPL